MMLVLWFVIGSLLNVMLTRPGVIELDVNDISDASVLLAIAYAIRVARLLPATYTVPAGTTRWLLIANTVNIVCLQVVAIAVAVGPVLALLHCGPEVGLGLFSLALIVMTFNTYHAIRFSGVTIDEDSRRSSRKAVYLIGVLGLCLVGLGITFFRIQTFSLGIIIPAWILIGAFVRDRFA